ncbi:MAG: hypothetical protein ACK55S_05805 [Planctomycetota bacterium]
MPVRPGLPTWLEKGGAMICPGRKPPVPAPVPAPDPVSPSEPDPRGQQVPELKLPGPGETISAELAIELMLREEYGLIQDQLDRLLSELI